MNIKIQFTKTVCPLTWDNWFCCLIVDFLLSSTWFEYFVKKEYFGL
jgi:hypothetical protein